MVNSQRQAIAELFCEVQGARPSRKNVVLLRQQLLEGGLEQFSAVFFDCLNRVLVCRKSDSNGDRVLKFVAHFVSMLQSDDEDTAEMFSDFTSLIVRHLLKGVESKEKNVRYRVCQLLSYVLTSGLNELDEDLFEALESALTKRLRDRESSVRVQAVIGIARFQPPGDDENAEEPDDDSATKITEVLLHVLSHDPSAEVRRTVLHHLAQSASTLPFLLERARDFDPILRRQIYSTILPSVNGFKPLSISKRNKLLKWGLKDRDHQVRRAAERMFAVDWLNLANGSILELLQRLDIVNSPIGEDVMRAFFATRTEFIPQINLDREFWDELTPESVFLVRCMKDFAQENEFAAIVADKLPELSSLSDLIVKYIVEANAQKDAEKIETEFMIENLLKLALKSDFSDEIGRRRLISNCHEILRSGLCENLLQLSVKFLSAVMFSEQELTTDILKIIAELYETLQEENEPEDSFHSAGSSPIAQSPATPTHAETHADADADAVQVRYIFTTLRVLCIVNSLLLYTSRNLAGNPGMHEMLQNIIVPAYRSHEGPICEKGIECLGQICLQDKELAKKYLGHFLNCFAKGYEELRILALQCVTDILIVHPELLVNSVVEEDTEAAKELGGTHSSLADDLARVYVKAFQLEDLPEVTAMATRSVSKLLLFNVLSPESQNARGLLKEMAILYYSPDSAHNQSLRQNLAYFFPVYSYSSLEHQTAMTTIVVSTIKRIARLYDDLETDEKADAVSLMSIATQLIEWTAPHKSAAINQGPQDGQIVLIDQISRRLQSSDKEESRALCSALLKIYVPREADLEALIQCADDIIEAVSDPVSKRMVIKFKTNLSKLCDAEGTNQTDLVPDESGNQTIGDITEHSILESVA